MSLLGLALASFGCGSTTTTDLDASTYVYPDTGTTPMPYSLSPGTYCYDITGASNVSDACALGVAGLVGTASLSGTYDSSTGQFTLGTEGSLGTGLLSQNTGTLKSIADTSDGAACFWHQTDTTILTMTGQNMFSVAVTEQKSAFAGCSTTPTGGTCTSTWTWTMEINANKVAPDCL
jgi:hypothetical protein